MPWDIYISSSWKQREHVRSLAIRLREQHLTVYDFTDPSCRQTPEIPPEKFPVEYDGESDYKSYICSVPDWRNAVLCNQKALQEASGVLLVLPCGSDAHADWAYALGLGKRTAVLGKPLRGSRSPVHMWAEDIFGTDEEAIRWCLKAACRILPED